MPGAIGEAFVEIRPDTSAFERSLQSNLPTSLNRVGQNLSVPVKANTSQWEADWVGATTRVKERFGRIFEYAAIGGGLYGAFDVVKTGLQGVEQEAQQARQATIVFGQDGGKALQKWSDNSVSALGLTKGATLETVNQLGNMLRGFGDKDSLPDAEALTTRVRQIADAQGKPFEEVQNTFIAALRSGKTTLMRELIPDINDADLKDKAQQMGLITTSVNDPKVAKMRADLKVLNDEIAKAQKGGTADPQTIELAQMRVTAAYNAHGEAVKKLGAGSQSALTTQIALVSAEDALTKARQSSVPDQDKVNQLLADRGVLQQQIDDAEKGSLDNLDQNSKALALFKLSLQDTANLPAPSGPAFDVEKTDAAFKTAEEHLATGLLPQVEKFSDWVGHHGTDINNFADNLGKFLGTAADGAGKVIGWFTDHPQAFEAIAGLFVAKKAKDWGEAGVGVLKDVIKYAGTAVTAVEKIFGVGGKTLPSVGGGGGVPSPAMSVGEMTVGTLIAKSMLGGGGLPGGGGEPIPAVTTTTEGKLPLVPPALLGAVMLAPTVIPGSFSTDPEANPAVGKIQSDLKSPSTSPLSSLLASSGTVGTDPASQSAALAAALTDHTSRAFGDLVKDFAGTGSSPDIGGPSADIQALSGGWYGSTQAEKDAIAKALDAAKSMAYDQTTFLTQVSSLFQSEEADMQQAAAIIYSTRLAQNALEAQTTGKAGAQLNAGVGSVNLGRQTFRSTAVGGWFDVPTPVVVGDAPSGGEAVLNSPQLHAVVAGAVASALSQFAPRSTAQGMVFSPTINGVGMDELKAVMEREFYRFMRLWNDNQQRGLPPMHGFSSS